MIHRRVGFELDMHKNGRVCKQISHRWLLSFSYSLENFSTEEVPKNRSPLGGDNFKCPCCVDMYLLEMTSKWHKTHPLP